MKEILISVVVPIYNGMPYLPETIEALLNQKCEDESIEFLFIDDGSSDDSVSYLEGIQDARVRVIKQLNMGLCNSLNNAAKIAKGEYFARCDQDDISLLNRLDVQLRAIRDFKYDAVFSYVTKIGDKAAWSNLDKLKKYNREVKGFEPWVDGCLLNSTMLIKRDVFLSVGGYRENYYPADDWDLELRLYERYAVGVVCISLVIYRFHSGANTLKYWNKMQDNRRLAEYNYYQRLGGASELTLNDYLSLYSTRYFVRINRWRKDFGKLYMRKAGGELLSGSKLKFFLFFMASFFFLPDSAVKRVYNYMCMSLRNV